MWYVKDEFSEKIYFKSNDVRKTQDYASRYNHNFKFAGQRMFSFVISDFSGLILFWESKVDVCPYTSHFRFPCGTEYTHPLSIKNFGCKHTSYLKKKYELMLKLCKKYHLWSYNEYGRKCDGFDF